MKSTIRHFLILIFALTLIRTNSSAQPFIYAGGNITENTTWSADTVKVTADITVADNVKLTINPGTIVQFQDYYSFDVDGSLVAEGTPGDSIVFCVLDTTGYSDFENSSGGWGGFTWYNSGGMMNDNDSSFLTCCVILNTKDHNNYGNTNGGAIYCYNFSKVVIEDCRFSHYYARSYGGCMYLNYTDITVKDNLFMNGLTAGDGGVIFTWNGNPSFVGNEFKSNSANSGGAMAIRAGNPSLLNNTFDNNFSKNNGGAVYLQGTASGIFTENEFTNNSTQQNGGALFLMGKGTLVQNNEFNSNHAQAIGGGIYVYYNAIVTVQNNEIQSNTAGSTGGGIFHTGDTLILSGNQIFDNSTSTGSGGGLATSNSSYTRSDNNTFHDNYSGQYGGAIIVSYSTLIMKNDSLYNNSASKYGGALSLSDADPVITSCFFSNNEASLRSGAINIKNTNGIFMNNIIVNNEAYAGGAMFLENSSPLFINNTICNNRVPDPNNGGLAYINVQCFPVFYNNIIYGNTSDTLYNHFFFLQMNPIIDFYNNLIQGGIDGFSQLEGSTFLGRYTNNIEVDPLLIDPSDTSGLAGDGITADWKLGAGSPCINAGIENIIEVTYPETDYYGDNRIRYSYIDIGSHEYHNVLLTKCGNILQDEIWTADTVKICGDMIVTANSKIIIHPGTVVQFQGFYKIAVGGIIHAAGTMQDNIIFTIHDTTGFSSYGSTDGAWDGFDFTAPPANDTSKFIYSQFEYCKSSMTKGVFYLSNTPKLLFDGCTFRNNVADYGACLNFTGSYPVILNCLFEDNHTVGFNSHGSAIYMSYSTPVIRNCVFRNNTAEGSGVIYMTQSNPTITDCIITDNYSAGYGGAIRIFANSRPIVKRNVIHSNVSEQGGGMYINNNCTPDISLNFIANNRASKGGGLYGREMTSLSVISNNIIVNNSADDVGGGIILENNSNPEFIGNTIANNISGSTGGGLYCTGSNPIISNSIFWGNQDLSGINQIDLTSSVPHISYSNIQGGLTSITGDSSPEYENNIDSIPRFMDPTDGAGYLYSTIPEDWYVIASSPSVNSGNPDHSNPHIPDKDILGKPRIHFGQIDMGAIENQAGLPVITQQPGTLVKCEGEPALFSIQTNDSVFYQWKKDGINIPGANTSLLEFDSVFISNQGSYTCILLNSYGSVSSNPVYLHVKEKPVILQGPTNTWAEINKNVTLETFAQGSDLKYQWMKDSVEIPGAVIPKLTILNAGFVNEGFYNCKVYNSCGSVTTSTIPLYIAPHICMVTVDPVTGSNLVIWEKQSIAPIMEYKIYREGRAAGIYDRMGTIPYDDLSVFVDTTADPTIQAYLYKITGVDTAGNETDLDLCSPHKTIHLLVSTNPELKTTQLEWDRYYGFEYQTYIIYRSPTGTGFTPIHYLASTLNSWTDPSPLPDIGYYRLAAEKPDPCYPSGGTKKADAGPYSHSMSNIEDNRLQEAGENQEPDSIILSSNTIDENKPVGTFIGRLETRDPDTTDHHVYKLVTGTGGDDNSLFTTMGDLLISAGEFDYESQNTLYIRIKSTDKGDLSTEQAFVILVNDVDESIPNEAPVGILLSGNNIAENRATGSLVGKIWTDDPDIGDVHTYSLVEGEGDDDNHRFMLLDDLLLSDDQFDYETEDTLYIRIRSTDRGDLSVEQAFIILITDVNEGTGNLAPTNINLSTNMIEENSPSGILIGLFTTEDPNSEDVHGYTLVEGLGAEDNEGFVIMGNILVSAAKFDYETKDTLYIRVKSEDQEGLSFERGFMIMVLDIFEPAPNLSPTDITLSFNTIDENQPVGTLIGRFQTDDPNIDDLHTYRFVEGTGEDNNNSFSMIGDLLISAEIFDFEANEELTIRVKSTDNGDGSLSYEKSFIIYVADVIETGLSVQEDQSFNVSPNPFSERTMIRFSNPDGAKYQFVLTDLAGKVLYHTGNIYTGEFELKRNDLPPGYYIIELRGPKLYRGSVLIE